MDSTYIENLLQSSKVAEKLILPVTSDAQIKKLNIIRGNILNHGGTKFEKIVTSKFIEVLCNPYLENFTKTKILPAHFADFLTNKKINCRDYLTKFMQEAKNLHYEEILEKEKIYKEESKHYQEDFFDEMETSRNKIYDIINAEKEITGNRKLANVDKSSNSGSEKSSLSKKGSNIADRPASLTNITEIEIDIAFQKVKGSDLNQLLASLQESGSVNKIFAPSNKDIIENNFYNIFIEVGKDAINYADSKIIQMLKIIYFFRNIQKIYNLQAEKMTKSKEYINQQLGIDLSNEFVFILITNGNKDDFLSIPNNSEELQKCICDPKYSNSKARAFKFIQILKEKIKNEFVFFCHLDDSIGEQNSRWKTNFSKEMDKKLEIQKIENQLKQEELMSKLDSQQKEHQFKLDSQQKEHQFKLESQQKEHLEEKKEFDKTIQELKDSIKKLESRYL